MPVWRATLESDDVARRLPNGMRIAAKTGVAATLAAVSM
jgi:hypothetical protein